jgi:hypothetical protein
MTTIVDLLLAIPLVYVIKWIFGAYDREHAYTPPSNSPWTGAPPPLPLDYRLHVLDGQMTDIIEQLMHELSRLEKERVA